MNTDIQKLVKEVTSPGLRQVVESLWDVVERVRSGAIDHRQASAETAAHKHMIQSIALDWLYNRKAKNISLLQQPYPEINSNALQPPPITSAGEV